MRLLIYSNRHTMKEINNLMDSDYLVLDRRLREIYGTSEDVEFHLNRNIIQGDVLTDTYEFYEKFTGFDEW